MSNKPIVHIVDDDDGVRESLSLLLEMHGYGVRTFPSGDQFLQELSTIEPGCISSVPARIRSVTSVNSVVT